MSTEYSRMSLIKLKEENEKLRKENLDLIDRASIIDCAVCKDPIIFPGPSFFTGPDFNGKYQKFDFCTDCGQLVAEKIWWLSYDKNREDG